MNVAALYIDPRGPYPKMSGVDCWDETRDARIYAGPWPVVAHPPCGPWGGLRHLYEGAQHDCGPAAIAAARRWGGVVEHPAHSQLWRTMRLPFPGEFSDEHGGFTLDVDQCAWGHVARKRSWIYVVGVDRAATTASVRTGGTPTHWISGFHWKGQEGRPRCDAAPNGIKICSAAQRRRTPPAFAAWLVGLARASRATSASVSISG